MAQFQIQQSASVLNWTGKKVLGLHTGTLGIKNGYIQFTNGLITAGEIQLDMTSIAITDIDDAETRNNFLGHLMNDDFFAVDKYKTASLIVLHAKEIKPHVFEITADLTIKDITHNINFTVAVEVFTDYMLVVGDAIVDRTKYNMRYGSGKFIQNLGDKLIYDNFSIQFKLVAQKNS